MDETSTTRHWLDDPPTVGAVLVAHNGARWLPKVLASFSDMFHAPTSWQVVDVSSTDGSADLLRDSFGAERITYAPSGTGFGDAVRLGLESMPRTDWIWLLHDDASVLPGTLSGLLDTATSATDIAAVGPKIREWPSLRRLLEVGLTITATGSRETGLETGEPDAGQHDRPRDVLAVNTSGMLIRRDVWDELGGLDPNLPLFFDDIDLGWRVARAGYRTMTAPTAVMFHAEASERGTRSRTAGDVPGWEPRRAALYTMLANTPMPRFLWQYLRLLFGSLLRVAALMIGKDPEAAGDELRALRSVYLHPRRLVGARRRRRPSVRRDHREIQGLFAPFWLPYQHGLDIARHTVTALVKPEAIETVGRRSTTLDQAPDEAVDLDDGPSLFRRRPWLAVVLALIVLSLIAGRAILSGNLNGGALPPSPESAGGWWQLALASRQDVGLPTDVLPPAFAFPLAILSTPVWFAPGLLVTTLLVFAVPLAALTAHRFGRQISAHRIPRIVWAISYALCGVAVGAVNEGRIGTVVAMVLLPIIANTAWQLAEKPGWQLALRLGVWVALASAFAPIVLVLSLGGLLVLWYAEGRWVRRQLALAAAVPLVLLGPWLAQRALRPWRVWWEAGYPLPGSATIRDVVLGRAGATQAAPEWLTVGLLVLALLALIPRRTRSGVIISWLVALLGLAAALAGTLVTYSTQAGPADITPWVGVPAIVWSGGLLTAVLLAVPTAMSWPRPALATAIVVALVLPIGTGAWWLVRGLDDPVGDGRPTVVPVFLAERAGDTLLLTGSIANGVDYRVVAADGPFLGQEAVITTASESAVLTAVTRRILAQATSADIEALSGFGIDAIYAPDVDPELARRIDAAPKLEASGSDQPGSRVWTLAAEPDLTSAAPSVWHRIVVVLQALVWVVAIVMTAPIRRRADPDVSVDGETEEIT
ncbi:glycosyltransferase family 2 protein [Aeromicrobium sp.]|uniref:glycosyltransferase family 2 protein n=1 Tax=Aeromicrobium sp. TaxID=1871063 RepID=UPI003C58558D